MSSTVTELKEVTTNGGTRTGQNVCNNRGMSGEFLEEETAGSGREAKGNQDGRMGETVNLLAGHRRRVS